MNRYLLSPAASETVADIHYYSTQQWGNEQADRYLYGLTHLFEQIADGIAAKKPIDARLGIDGYSSKYGRHVAYWQRTPDGMIYVAAILHERMDLIQRIEEIDWNGVSTDESGA